MPNWVTNTVTITGESDTLDRLTEQLNRPVTTRFNGTERTIENPVISLHNIISPPEDICDSYYAERDPLDHETEQEGLSFGDAFRHKIDHSNHWYFWNVRNWGTKWDVVDDGEGSTKLLRDSSTHAVYLFDSAWSPPLEALDLLSRQFPDLLVELKYVEEYGWGAIIELRGGEVTVVREWDEPESHTDSIDLVGSCYCETGLEDAAFPDCPKSA